MRKLLVVAVLLLSGCVSREERTLIRQKHAESAVIAQRIDAADPTLRPTDAQKNSFIKATARDWENLDRLHNHWEPAPPAPVPPSPPAAVPAPAAAATPKAVPNAK